MSVGTHIKQYIFGALAAVFLLGIAAEVRAGVMYGITGAQNSNSTLYTIDTTTLATTLVGATGFSHMTGLAANSVTGALYGHVSDLSESGTAQLVSINKSTGAGSVIGSTGTQVSDLSFDTSGTLYGWTASESGVNGLITIDLGTAAITFVEPPSLQTSRTGLAFDSGDDLYLKDWNQLFAVDPLTAQLSSVGSVAGASNLHNVLEFGESGTLFTVSRQGSQSLLYTLDTADASATLVGDIGIAIISALAYEESTVAVTEPGAGAFLGLGFLGLGWLRRQRR
jgi:MYXO-CTERM domain-containing protein